MLCGVSAVPPVHIHSFPGNGPPQNVLVLPWDSFCIHPVRVGINSCFAASQSCSSIPWLAFLTGLSLDVLRQEPVC